MPWRMRSNSSPLVIRICPPRSCALFPADPNGVPFQASYISTTGDYIADLESDMAAEQRARATYEHLMDLTNDPDILAPLAFLRQREVVHYQRFKELRNYYLEKQKNS